MPVIPPLPEQPSYSELLVDRLNTQAMIAGSPTAITLIPRMLIRTGSGVHMEDLPPRQLQIGRLLNQQQGASPTETSGDGFQRKDLFQLLLPWDGEVELNDYWHDEDGLYHTVTGILPYNGYERRAEVTRFGQKGQPPN